MTVGVLILVKDIRLLIVVIVRIHCWFPLTHTKWEVKEGENWHKPQLNPLLLVCIDFVGHQTITATNICNGIQMTSLYGKYRTLYSIPSWELVHRHGFLCFAQLPAFGSILVWVSNTFTLSNSFTPIDSTWRMRQFKHTSARDMIMIAPHGCHYFRQVFRTKSQWRVQGQKGCWQIFRIIVPVRTSMAWQSWR